MPKTPMTDRKVLKINLTQWQADELHALLEGSPDGQIVELFIPPNGFCHCGQPGVEKHECPFNEIRGDTICNCCDACARECAEDI